MRRDTRVKDVIRRALTVGLAETALRCVPAKMAASAIFKMATVTVHQDLSVCIVKNPVALVTMVTTAPRNVTV